MNEKKIADKIIGRVAVDDDHAQVVSELDGMVKAAKTFNAEEVIFCSGHLSNQRIIAEVQAIGSRLRPRFFAANSIISSDDKTSQGEILSADTDFRLMHPALRRTKRLLDVLVSVAFILTFPIHLVLVKNPLRFFENCFEVIAGKKTWVGYMGFHGNLPAIRTGVIGSSGSIKKLQAALPRESLKLMDFWYAHDYEPWQDMRIIFKNYRSLGS
jgi:hypothetical protein